MTGNMNFDHLINKKSINLQGQKLRDIDLDVLIKVIEKSDELVALFLGNNCITLANGHFTEALKRNHNLRVLNMHTNPIDDEGARCLAAALKVHKSLEQLHVGGNNIGDEGAQCLAESIRINQGLRKVWLHPSNGVGDKGVRALADALECNHFITEFKFMSRNISTHLRRHIKIVFRIIVTRNADAAQMDRKVASQVKTIESKDAEIAMLRNRVASLEANLPINVTTPAKKRHRTIRDAKSANTRLNFVGVYE